MEFLTMKGEIKLGQIAGLRLSAVPSAIIGSILLWIALFVVGIGLIKLRIDRAVIGATAAFVLHWLGEIIHQFGHAWAARRTGYPMTGIRFWGVLSASVYPDEPPLPAAVHIRRALGGPSISAIVALLAGILLVLAPGNGLLFWVARFFFLDNLFIFTLGALLPLGFTDGSTLLYWRGKP
jgi:hypothetical protein